MRLFIATSFPEPVLRTVNDRIARVKSKLPAASWVRHETQHLTFAFLGEQPESLLTTLTPLVESSLAKIPRFNARLQGGGFFPNRRHARVGWVGATPEDSFRAVADAVRSAVTAAGVELDRADFRPHLTLFRIRDRWPPACTEIFVNALQDYESDPFLVDAVTLFSSELNPKGAVHTPLQKFALA
ncbi:MAG: 2,3-cyclic 3-phosphodiesterase [Thermoanaerobaculia bacterium]|jgi:2'-5' RNA ligase|nr:2,3-cyclic 3-phosphodiesterase [Thermoanaerobaculia bacterium]